MNFNVHRRNKSLVTQSSFRQKKEVRSLKKMNNTNCADNILTEAKDIYQSQGDLTEAVRLFLQYLTLNPYNNQALYLCAVCQMKIGQYQNAITHLIAIPDDCTQKANSILLHAMTLNKLGKTTQSLQIVNECIRRYQNFEEAICFRGKLYMSLSYYHKAQQDFKNLISRSSCTFLPHNSLGDCYRSQGKPEKALGPYLKALQKLQSFQSNKSSEAISREVFLKIGICLYQLQRWKEAKSYIQQAGKLDHNQSCQYHYYLGGTLLKLAEKQKGVLHLQYCLRTQGSFKLMRKAYKKLIQLYLQNYQFYEALNIVRLGDIINLQIEGWDRVVGAFMLIIKGSFEEGLLNLNEIYSELKLEKESKRLLKIKRDSSQGKPPKQSRYNQNSKIEKKLFAPSPVKMSSQDKDIKGKFSHTKMKNFSTKSVVKAVPKIDSMRLPEKSKVVLKIQQETILKTDYGQKQGKKQLYDAKQKQFMYPLVLQFKAYSQFFTGKYVQCLDTYDEYQNFIKDVFGKDSDVVYNKTICQGLLMAESDMQEEALTKYSTCIDLYYQKNGVIPVQPLLYKIILLVRLALEQASQNEKMIKLQEEATSTEILQSTIEMMDNYQAVLSNHSLSLYFRGLIYLLLNRYQESRQWLQKALKIAEDCSWRCLWVKGVVQLKMGNYYQAVKQFSAGLILENRAQLYLGRSISFLLLSEQAQKGMTTEQVKTIMKSVHLGETNKNQKQSQERNQAKKKSDNLIQNCFQDLQKYIELQTSQQDISLWVSKILFRNKAYDEAIRSLRKIRNISEEVSSMIESIEIYEGNFQKGGEIGVIIKSAFEGIYLTQVQESRLLHSEVIHNLKRSKYLQENEEWMVSIHLYVTQNYSLLLKYLQKQLFNQINSKTALLLRYNIMIAYFLLGQQKKAVNACKAMLSTITCPTISKIMKKIQTVDFDKDECLQDLKEDLNLSCSKLLSNYLPFRSIFIDQQKTIRIYLRPSIPFPQFSAPLMNLVVGTKLIASQIVSSSVQKKLEAPWIRKTEKKTVQFMQKLQESGVYLTGETSSFKEAGSQPFLV